MPQPLQGSSAFWNAVQTNIALQHHAPPIPRAPRNENLPLSFAQERLWLVEQAHPGSVAHNLRAVFHLQGALEIPLLEQSLREIARRHEILRTTFPAVAGQPIQRIAPDAVFALPVSELTGLPPAQREAEIRRRASAEAQQPFDLAQGPLLRFKLLRLAADEHILLRTTHHLINDRWSDSLFMRELGLLYAAFVTGRPAALPELPIQYADFAHFQRQWLQGDILETQLRYWQSVFSGKLPLLALPFDHAAPSMPSYQGAAQYLTLPKYLTEALNALSRQQEMSLFVILFAAFNLLLYQYSGQEDLIVCAPVSGRHRVETKKLIGYFSNLLPIRISLEQNPSFLELLARVSQVSLQVFEHQEMPLQLLAEALHLPGPVLSQVMFALQNVPSRPLEFAGISVTPLDIEEGIANFDLSLSIKTQADGLAAVLRYKTEMFQETTMTQFLARFQELLESLMIDPKQRVSDLARFPQKTPPQMASGAETAYVAPQTELEQKIALVWQDILQLEQIGIHANFFEIGGRSLAMVRVGQKLQTLLTRDVPIAALFERPTISGMAQYLSQPRPAEMLPARSVTERANRQKEALNRQKHLLQQRKPRS